MTAPRLTLGRLMAAVALIAAHAGLLRAAIRLDIELPILVGPPVLLLELAAWRAWQDRRPGRPFWLGYLVAGALATGSLTWALTHEGAYGLLPNGTYGLVRPPSALNRFWVPLLHAGIEAARGVARWLFGPVSDAVQIVLVLVVLFAPQVLPAVAGGMIGRGLGRRRGTSAAGGPAA